MHFSLVACRDAPRISTAILATLVLGSCSISLGSSPRTPPAASTPSGGPALQAAQADFFANRYTRAEAEYRKYIGDHARDATGHADFALFLNYNRRFSEALAEAQTAASLAPRSAVAAAVGTRVRDWSAKGAADIKTAVGYGAGAVKLGPRSALAHAFYSEALADSGDAVSAQMEVDIAATLAIGDYEKSEVEREKSNLAFDQNDKAAQLTHLLAAQKLQPGWAERTREVAEYYFGSGELDKAATQFQQAIAMAPNDVNLRVTLGSVALLQMDIAHAQEAYVAANLLKPNDPGIESTLAITSFATKRDTAESERLLRAATTQSPQSIDMAELLEGFLRYIKRDPAAANLVVVGKHPAEPIKPDSRFPVDVKSLRQATNQAALDALNAARAKAHLAPVRLDDRITEGATAHAYWWLFNLALPQVKGLGIHKEVSGTPGYTGFSMRDRATTFGYPQASMAEDITHRGTPAGAISDWVDSVYHRFPIMRPDLDAIGFGSATAGGLPIEVMDMGYRSQLGDPMQQVPFPADGQTGVPTAFLGNELPDPVPAGGKYPTGYPITVNYNPFVDVTVGLATVSDATGRAVPVYFIPPTRADENVLTLLPKQPLQKGARYTVSVTATVQGLVTQKQWSFTTEGAISIPVPGQQA